VTERQLHDYVDYMAVMQPGVMERIKMEEQMGIIGGSPAEGSGGEDDGASLPEGAAELSEEEKIAAQAALDEVKRNKQQDLNQSFRVACGAPGEGAAKDEKPNVGKAQALLSMGAEANGQDPVSGWTGLHHASGLGLKKMANFLLVEAEADSAVLDHEGCSACWVACFNGKRDSVVEILAVGGDCTTAGNADAYKVSGLQEQ
jgi:hypothetical protein